MNSKTLAIASGITGTLLIAGLATTSLGTAFAQTTDQTQSPSTVNIRHRGGPPGENMMKDVQKTVENISNGIKITITSTNADTVLKLQSKKHPPAPPEDKSNITVTQTNITNGIEITITSTDAATVTKIQTDAKNNQGFGPAFRGHKGRFMQPPEFNKNVTRTVQNIPNGITITLTSTDPATVTKLQSLKQPPTNDTTEE